MKKGIIIIATTTVDLISTAVPVNISHDIITLPFFPRKGPLFEKVDWGKSPYLGGKIETAGTQKLIPTREDLIHS